MTPMSISRWLAKEVAKLDFAPPTACVYNPLVYARRSHEAYLRQQVRDGVECLLVGMNPGPWGMAQTGVPFGEVGLVREFIGIDERGRSAADVLHPKRPIQGFACTRSEVSGRRLWGWAQERFGTAERFARLFFVTNYCPLVFMEESGRNRTPDKLPASERDPLFAVCDRGAAAAGAMLPAEAGDRRGSLCCRPGGSRTRQYRSTDRHDPPSQPGKPCGQPGLGRAGGAAAARHGGGAARHVSRRPAAASRPSGR